LATRLAAMKMTWERGDYRPERWVVS
jgi:hypothetical protein